jgi:hypothetical protein
MIKNAKIKVNSGYCDVNKKQFIKTTINASLFKLFDKVKWLNYILEGSNPKTTAVEANERLYQCLDAFKGTDTLSGLKITFDYDLDERNLNLINSFYGPRCTKLNVNNGVCRSMFNKPGMFNTFTKLKMAYFNYGKLKTLRDGIFSEMKNLVILELSCGLEHIESNAFQGLSNNLKWLYLSKNQFVKMDNFDCFNKLANLEILDLNNCAIQSISSRTFLGLNKLRRLDLGGNPIAEDKLKLMSKHDLNQFKANYSLPISCIVQM